MKRLAVISAVIGVLLLVAGCFPVPGDPGNGIVEPDAVVTAVMEWAQAANASRTVHFDGNRSSTTSGGIAFYEWTPGDGSPAVVTTVPEFAHVYPRWRTYTATLVVTNTDGRSASVAVEVTVEPLKPVARFSLTTDGKKVTFDAANSTADGEIVSARWWFGDGEGNEGEWPDVGQCWHKYTDFGTYTVTLTITDQHGQTATGTRRVTVPEP